MPSDEDPDPGVRLQGDTLRFMQLLWRLTHVLEVRSKRMARTLGVTGPQRLVLRLLGQHPDLTAREIAATLGIHPSTLTGIVARLERQQMIIRAVDPQDRRRARFSLAARGRRLDRERKGTVEASVRRGLARISSGDLDKVAEVIAVLTAELARDT